MKAKFKTKWIAALRSGKYKQGKGYLRHGNKFCCLGVACDISNPDLWVKADIDNHYTYEEWYGSMAPDTKSRIGLKNADHRKLWEMNDAQGKTFKEIADWIEENL